MAHEILNNEKSKVILFSTREDNSQLFPLCENRAPIFLHIAGKKIIEWIYLSIKNNNLGQFIILCTEEDKQLIKETLVDYLEVNPKNEEAPIVFLDYNPKKGLTRELSKQLIEIIPKHSLWIDGNVAFTHRFLGEFLRNTNGKDKFALVRINDEQKEFMGIGFFDKSFLEPNLLGSKSAEEIYRKISAKTKSYFNTMEYIDGKTEFWKINYLWNLLDANEILINNIENKNNGTVEVGATIGGKVNIGEGTIIRAGSYLQGPLTIGKNCVIGPNCFIRKGVSLDDNVNIGNACELKNTIVYKGTHIAHLSYVGDSVVGEKCNFGAGTITGNLRLDDNIVKSKINEEVKSTQRRKLGVIMGDNVKTAINVYFMPGVIVGNNSAIGTGVILNRNLDSNSFVYLEQQLQVREWIASSKEKKKSQ